MYQYPDGRFALELVELIKMNRLVRGQIDLAGFQEWYDGLSHAEQITLMCHLHEFAQQAGGGEDVLRAAAVVVRLPLDHPLLVTLASFRGDFSWQLGVLLSQWLTERNVEERRVLFPVFVYYFGLAEGAVFARETVEHCNHWWHRDLLDARVVRDLLDDPSYHMTSSRDDLAIKQDDSSGRLP